MLNKTELQTISQIAEKLDYYQLLKIPQHASEAQISEAYHREALLLHPDIYQSSSDPELSSLSKKIFSRIVEAYRTLSSKERRIAYDKSRGQTDSAENEVITSVTQKTKSPAASAGLRFFKLAQAAYQARDLNSAKVNIQIALNADPNNPELLALLQRIEIEIKK